MCLSACVRQRFICSLLRALGVSDDPRSAARRLRACGVELDEERQSAWLDQQEIELTGAEFRMLRYFMLNPGRLLSKIALSEHLYDGESERDSNVVEVHINRLRRKLGGQVIQTRRGQGYLFTGRG